MESVKRIDHIGIAVENLEEALRWYSGGLGLELHSVERVEDQQVRVALLPAGESRIELLETTDPYGPIGRFISRRGAGIHHVALQVGDIDEALRRAKDQGLQLIDEVPRSGAGGSRIAFIHPKSTGGVLIELCQPADVPDS